MYGTGEYGASLFYGGTPYLAGDGPFIVSSTPVAGSAGAAQLSVLTIVVDSVNVIDPTTTDLTVQGQQVIVGGIFQSGFSGSVVQSGSTAVITVTVHPIYDMPAVDVLLDVSDGAGISGAFTFSFTAAIDNISDLVAATYCEGKRIDLAWTTPVRVTQMRIYRSTFAFANFTDNPAEIIYEGVSIDALSDTGLEENVFYYYTIAISYTPSAPFVFLFNDDGKVTGLSITDYNEADGGYVYNLLPHTYRLRDSEPTLESSQFLTRDYADFIQCGINLYRGWFESVLKIKDPDTMPAGRVGTASNQRGILKATSVGFGLMPEESYDAGVLRRIALGIVGVYKIKGTCPGTVDLCKILTTWDSRCVEAIEPVCGINRLFRAWDGSSEERWTRGFASDPNNSSASSPVVDATTPGILIIDKDFFWSLAFLVTPFQPVQIGPNSLALSSDSGVLDGSGVLPATATQVTTWVDQSLKGNDAVQSVFADQPVFVSVAGGSTFPLRPQIEDVGTTFMESQLAAGTNFINGSSASFFFVVNVSTFGAKKVLLSIETGPLECLLRVTAAVEMGFTDTTGEVSFGVAPKAGNQAILMTFDAAGLEAKLYVDNQLLATAAYAPPATLSSDRVTLGDAAGGPGSAFDGSFGEVLAVDRVIIETERDLLWNLAALKYDLEFGTKDIVPLTSSGESTVVGVLSNLGDFACVSTVTESSTHYTFTLEEEAAVIRAEIRGSATRIDAVSTSTFDVTSIDTTHFPWQFPAPAAEPVFEVNALVGLRIVFDAATIPDFEITANDATNASGDTRLTLSAAGPAGTNDIAISTIYSNTNPSVPTFAGRIPLISVRFLIGETSLLVDPIWDTRLLRETEEGPWSLLTGLGTTISGLGYVPGPADITLFVENQDEIVGFVDVITSLSLQDTDQNWLVNQWSGFFVLPNWNQNKLYRIAGNNTDTLFVIVDGGGMETVAGLDSVYVILKEENAIKYRRLVAQMLEFIPLESRPFVKFEEVETTFLATFFSSLLMWVKGTQGLLLDTTTSPATAQGWTVYGSSNDGVFENLTKAGQPEESTLSSEPSLLFDGSDDVLVFTGAKLPFSPLHSGTGATLVAVIGPVSAGGVAFATDKGTALDEGISLARAGSGAVELKIFNTSGVYVVNTSVALAAGSTAKVIFRSKTTGFATQWELRVNGVASTGSFVGTPSASTPGSPPSIGAFDDATSPIDAEIPEVFVYDRHLLDFEADRIDRYLAATY